MERKEHELEKNVMSLCALIKELRPFING